MAKLDKMPSQEIIDGFKGTLDYYVHMGIPCVRSWPRAPSMPRSPAVQETAAIFGELSTALSATPANIVDQAIALAAGTTWTWRDILTRAAYGYLIS